MSILQSETDADAAEAGFFLPLVNDPLTGKTGQSWTDAGGGLTSEVQYRLPGGVFQNALISDIVEIGFGIYALRFSSDKLGTLGNIQISVSVSGAQPWTGYEPIVTQGSGVFVGETVDARRELEFHLPNSSDPLVGVTGHSFSTGQVKIRLPGGSFANADVSRVVEKGNGDYALRLTDAQVVDRGKIMLYVSVPGAQPWTSWYEVVPEAGVSVDPGTLISVSGTRSRWSPIVATLDTLGNSLWIFIRSGNNWMTLYDPVDGFAPWMRERSSIEDVGSNQVVTLLPNGGWWARDFSVTFVSGSELTL